MSFTNPESADSAEAFAAIGQLMSSWVSTLAERDERSNAAIALELERFKGRARWQLSGAEEAEQNRLRSATRTVRSVAYLKRTGSGVASVLAGSAGMDTGAALMLLSSHADFSRPEDQVVSDSLVALIRQARPAAPDNPIALRAVRYQGRVFTTANAVPSGPISRAHLMSAKATSIVASRS